jgi:hypothetical protein
MADEAQRHMDISEAIDLFLDCQARHGMAAPCDPASEADLAALSNAIAPMRLPEELTVLWRRFQREEGALADGYELQSALRALEGWRFDLENMQTWPLCLLPIAYESHHFVWIELHGESDLDGGAIWKGSYAGEGITRIAPSLADLVDAVVAGWDAGFIEKGDNSRALVEDDDGWANLLRDRFGEPLIVKVERYNWPPRWLALSGLQVSTPFPLEAITPIGQLGASVEWLGNRTVVVQGQMRTLSGMAAGARCLIDDGTGELEFWKPAEASCFADSDRPGISQVELIRGSGSPQESNMEQAMSTVSSAATQGDIERAQSLTAEFLSAFDMTEAPAVAISVRWGGYVITPIGDLLGSTDWQRFRRMTIEGVPMATVDLGTGQRITLDDGTGQLDVWVRKALGNSGNASNSRLQVDVIRYEETLPPSLDSFEKERRGADAIALAVRLSSPAI